MTIAIMQPYFLPYLGYYQLIDLADQFVIYDNIQYTKKGWINRNRILVNGREQLVSIPLKKGSDFLNIDQRYIAPDFNRKKLLNLVAEGYKKAPQFLQVFPLIREIVEYKNENLFDFLFHSIQRIAAFMHIRTPIIRSSEIPADHSLHSQERILAICNRLKSQTYVNPVGGLNLYNKSEFARSGVTLRFHNMLALSYPQLNGSFVSHLSIIDVLMFNSPETYPHLLSHYELL